MNIRQVSSVIIILLMAAAIFTLFARKKDPVDTEFAGLETRLTESELDSKLEGDVPPAPLDLAELEVEDEIEIEEFIVEEDALPVDIIEEPIVAVAPAQCTYPGDGFTPTIRGANPTDFVPFEYPRAKTGGEPSVQPALPEEDTACVVLTYDISASGDVINVEVYDVQPASAAREEYYKKTAVVAVREQSYYPGARNGKPVQIDNNVMEVRFEAVN